MTDISAQLRAKVAQLKIESDEPKQPNLGYLFRCYEVQYAAPLDEWEIPVGEGRVVVYCHAYKILKRTPKGAWIDNYGGERKFVLLTARKKYACETEEDARLSFIARKQRHASILRAQLKTVEKAQRIAENNDIHYLDY